MSTSAALKQLRKPLNLSKLPPWKARVEIAKDVIAAVKTRRVRVETGAYVDGAAAARLGPPSLLDDDTKHDLRSLLGQSKPCSVCAVGACLVALVARENKFDVAVGYAGAFAVDSRDIAVRLRKYFTPRKLAVIEAAFETEDADGNTLDTALHEELSCVTLARVRPAMQRAYKFGRKHRTAKARLAAIMENIIENRGEFVP